MNFEQKFRRKRTAIEFVAAIAAVVLVVAPPEGSDAFAVLATELVAAATDVLCGPRIQLLLLVMNEIEIRTAIIGRFVAAVRTIEFAVALPAAADTFAALHARELLRRTCAVRC